MLIDINLFVVMARLMMMMATMTMMMMMTKMVRTTTTMTMEMIRGRVTPGNVCLGNGKLILD